MRHWELTKLTLLCGGCGAHLPKNTPIQVIELPAVRRKKFRGPCCASEAAPPLEEFQEPPTDREIITDRMESIQRISKRAAREYLPYKESD